MSSNIQSLNQLMVVESENTDGLLGKIVYFGLSGILVRRESLLDLCDSMNFPKPRAKRVSNGDAFRSATGDIHDRLLLDSGIYKIYFRDNKSEKGYLSRELVKEALDSTTNQYTKLANVRMSRESGVMDYENVEHDWDVSPEDYCRKALDLFVLHQSCANSRHIKTLLEYYLASMEAIKIVPRGNMYFVPVSSSAKVGLFEEFIAALNDLNVYRQEKLASFEPLCVNSMFVVDDEKQRQKMSEAFYIAVRREITEYMEGIDKLIQSGCESKAIAARWVKKVAELKAKKTTYEATLHQKLEETDAEYDSLQFMVNELQMKTAGPIFRAGLAA